MRTLPQLEIGQPETDSLLTVPTLAPPFASLGDEEFDDVEEENDEFDLNEMEDEEFDEFGEFDEEGEGPGFDNPDEFGDDEDLFEEGEEMGFDEEEEDI